MSELYSPDRRRNMSKAVKNIVDDTGMDRPSVLFRGVDFDRMSIEQIAAMMEVAKVISDAVRGFCNQPRFCEEDSYAGKVVDAIWNDANCARSDAHDALLARKPASRGEALARMWALLGFECDCGAGSSEIAAVAAELAAEVDKTSAAARRTREAA